MTFKVPASKASIKQNRFAFEIAGQKFDIPKMAFMPVSVGELIEAGTTSATLSIFGEKGTPLGDAIRTLDNDQLKALIDGWQADSGVTVGESEASSS